MNREKKQRREFMKQAMAISLDTVERERERERATILENGKAELLRTRTHTLCSLENKPSINFYALLKLYARDG